MPRIIWFLRGYGVDKALNFRLGDFWLEPEVAETGHDRLIADLGSVPHHCVQQPRRMPHQLEAGIHEACFAFYIV